MRNILTALLLLTVTEGWGQVYKNSYYEGMELPEIVSLKAICPKAYNQCWVQNYPTEEEFYDIRIHLREADNDGDELTDIALSIKEWQTFMRHCWGGETIDSKRQWLGHFIDSLMNEGRLQEESSSLSFTKRYWDNGVSAARIAKEARRKVESENEWNLRRAAITKASEKLLKKEAAAKAQQPVPPATEKGMRDIIRKYSGGVMIAAVLLLLFCLWAVARLMKWLFCDSTSNESDIAMRRRAEEDETLRRREEALRQQESQDRENCLWDDHLQQQDARNWK